MNKWMGLVLAVFGMGYGVASQTERAQLQAKLNALTTGIVSQDVVKLKSVLSPRLLDAAARQGPDLDAAIVTGFKSQRDGLLAQYGADWFATNEIKIVDIIPSGKQVAVSVEFHGATSPKLVYFELVDGDYRFAGTEPEVSVAEYASAAIWSSWPHWWFENQLFTDQNVGCGNCPFGGCGVTAVMPANGKVQNVNCLTQEYCTWYGTRCTNVETIWGVKFCEYQVFGYDGFLDPNGDWFCWPGISG